MAGTSPEGADDRGGEQMDHGERNRDGGTALDPAATGHPTGDKQAQDNSENEPAG